MQLQFGWQNAQKRLKPDNTRCHAKALKVPILSHKMTPVGSLWYWIKVWWVRSVVSSFVHSALALY